MLTTNRPLLGLGFTFLRRRKSKRDDHVCCLADPPTVSLSRSIMLSGDSNVDNRLARLIPGLTRILLSSSSLSMGVSNAEDVLGLSTE